MNQDNHIKFEQCFIIVDRKKRSEMVALLAKYGARMVKTIYAKGSVKASVLEEIFGFAAEENKVVLTSILPLKNAEELITALDNEYHFDKPNTGFAFTENIEGLSF